MNAQTLIMLSSCNISLLWSNFRDKFSEDFLATDQFKLQTILGVADLSFARHQEIPQNLVFAGDEIINRERGLVVFLMQDRTGDELSSPRR